MTVGAYRLFYHPTSHLMTEQTSASSTVRIVSVCCSHGGRAQRDPPFHYHCHNNITTPTYVTCHTSHHTHSRVSCLARSLPRTSAFNQATAGGHWTFEIHNRYAFCRVYYKLRFRSGIRSARTCAWIRIPLLIF